MNQKELKEKLKSRIKDLKDWNKENLERARSTKNPDVINYLWDLIRTRNARISELELVLSLMDE